MSLSFKQKAGGISIQNVACEACWNLGGVLSCKTDSMVAVHTASMREECLRDILIAFRKKKLKDQHLVYFNLLIIKKI